MARNDLLLRGGTLIDGRGGPEVVGDVAIVGGRVAAAGAHVTVPRSLPVRDVTGRFVVPGLIDTHVHAASDAEMEVYLRNGVTSIRYAGTAPGVVDDLRRRVQRGLPAPRIHSCGPMIDGVPPGYPDLSVTVDEPSVAGDVARSVLAGGADSLLLVQRVDLACARAIVEVGQAAEVPVFGQTWRIRGDEAAAIGFDQLDNTSRVLVSTLLTDAELLDVRSNAERIARWRQAWATLDELGTAEIRAAMVEHGVAYCPTLVRALWAAGISPCTMADLDEDADAAVFSDQQRTAWTRNIAGYRHGLPPAEVNEWEAAIDHMKAWIGEFAAAGGVVVAGADSNFGGISLHVELELLAGCGLSPSAVLVAATGAAADSLGGCTRAGVLEPGRFGDALVLADDPRRDVRALRRPLHVIVDGELVDTVARRP
jgi:imidazolonepropionase-like amidohydrolase